jgi:hypothetical protein
MNHLAGLAAVAVVLLLVLLPDGGPRIGQRPAVAAVSTPAAASLAPGGAAREDFVRVEHQFVHVQPLPAAPHLRVAVRRTAPLPAARRQDAARRMTRARRILVGDGRYRPEPFPRPAARRDSRASD